MIAWLLLMACSEYRVGEAEPVPPAPPPEALPDPAGDPPSDWAACARGFDGYYYNLPDNLPSLDGLAPEDPSMTDWWDEDFLAWTTFDASLDKGSNWWPVDSGIEGDPGQFAVRWSGWLRARSNTDLELLLGAADDAWVYVGDELVASQTDRDTLEPEVFTASVRSGVYPVRVLYSHRLSTAAGLRFRLLSDSVELCAPDAL